MKNFFNFIQRFSHYHYNSKEVRPGGLFFAVKGKKTDGHDHLEEAFSKGALAAVVSKDYKKNIEKSIYPVEDVLEFMHLLALEKFKRYSGVRIGVTGSVGKTTVKEFLHWLLKEDFTVEKTPKSFNSQISLPVFLLNGDLSKEVFIVEMGMSQKGEMEKLAKIVRPDIGILTAVGLAHAVNFSSIEEIKKEKMQIFSKGCKKALVPLYLKKDCPLKEVKTFSTEDPKADFFMEKTSSGYLFKEKNGFFLFKDLPFTETHLAEDFLIACSAARMLFLPFEKIEKRAQSLSVFDRRFEKRRVKETLFIIDCYNANPVSMRAAIENMPEGKRKIGVFGSMKELGAFSEKEHLEFAKRASSVFDAFVLIGDEMQIAHAYFLKKKKNSRHFAGLENLSEYLKKTIRKEDVVLIKGSRSFRMEKIMEFL